MENNRITFAIGKRGTGITTISDWAKQHVQKEKKSQVGKGKSSAFIENIKQNKDTHVKPQDNQKSRKKK